MPGKFIYEPRFKYPHLLGEDKIVWDKFIQEYPDRFDSVDYDIHVGSGIEFPGNSHDNAAEQYRNLTKKRIDVIGYKNESRTIIEVKHRVGLDTLGQVLGYRYLYTLEYPEVHGLPLLVVCAIIGPDDIKVLDHFNVSFVVV